MKLKPRMQRFAALGSLLALAACSSPGPVESFAPLDYSYLPPLDLKVATVNVVDAYVPSPAETALNANNPAPPGPTLMAMLNHRLQPSGQPGTATVTVQVASISEAGGMLNGQMTVDISLASPDGRSTGFAEADVAASETAPDSSADANDVQAALYQMTKKLMTQMNVQLPYQITHNVANWVVWTTPQGGGGGAPVTAAPIQSTPLTAPLAAPGASGSPAVPNYLPGAGPATLVPGQ